MDDGVIIIRGSFPLTELKVMAEQRFSELVKGVADIRRKVLALGGELHADEESELLQDGSKQDDLWGMNLYPEKSQEDWIEFDSMINIRPRLGNRSRFVEAAAVREQIVNIVESLIKR